MSTYPAKRSHLAGYIETMHATVTDGELEVKPNARPCPLCAEPLKAGTRVVRTGPVELVHAACAARAEADS